MAGGLMPLILDGEGRGLNTRHEGCARRSSLEAVPLFKGAHMGTVPRGIGLRGHPASPAHFEPG